MGTDGGVILWDLARKAELGFLPIGNAWHTMFEPSGNLLTNGDAGVLRWPIQKDPTSGEFRIGPPRRLPLRGTHCGIAVDRTCQIVAVAGQQDARVALGNRTLTIGPLDDCRGVSISPDGKWLSTSNHTNGGVSIWSLPEGARVARLSTDGGGVSQFSPDGNWLVTSWSGSSRLWEVGSWREVRQIEGGSPNFSPDGRLAIVVDVTNVLRLIEIETGRILARFDRPDQQSLQFLTFSPDGSRLVGTTNEPPSTQVIDLRAIRRRLAAMGLDWDAPAYPMEDPADRSAPPLPPLQVDYGPLKQQTEQLNESPAALLERSTQRLQSNSNDVEAYHNRAHALIQLQRPREGIEDLNHALRLRPDDGHLLFLRGSVYVFLKDRKAAIADLEAALKSQPDQPSIRKELARCCNDEAWELANGPESTRDVEKGLLLIRQAVDLAPGEATYLNTLGVVQYRAGRYLQAVTTLERSLEAGHGQSAAFDLFFLAMANHRLGHREEARRCLDRGIESMGRSGPLTDDQVKELSAFRAEATGVLADPGRELPADAFAPADVGP